MKIYKLTESNTFKPITAYAKLNKQDMLEYYIEHGMRGIGLWQCIIKLSYRILVPEKITDQFNLGEDNNYTIIPVTDEKTGKIAVDEKNNSIYRIHRDNNSIHADDILVLWEIPNKMYTDVKFNVKGHCQVICEGRSGRIRGDNLYSSPAPVIEIYGDCVLEWSGKSNGVTVGNTITYHANTRSITTTPIK